MNHGRMGNGESFERRVRVAMAEAGIRSVSELARLIRRPRSTVHRVLSGTQPFPNVIREIEDALSLRSKDDQGS